MSEMVLISGLQTITTNVKMYILNDSKSTYLIVCVNRDNPFQ